MATPVQRTTWELATVFAVLYFAQGIAEPTEGLIAQPVRSLLSERNYSPRTVGYFAAAIAIPWSLKPLFGLLSDFVPLFGMRRKSYLLLSSGMASVTLLALYVFPPVNSSLGWLVLGLLLPTVGVAMADVVIDALMVEHGQPLGITGKLQSIQWSAMYAAMIMTGWTGGWLSEGGRQTQGFLICGLVLLPTLWLVRRHVGEPASVRPPGSWRGEWRLLWRTMTSRGLLTISLFLLLWNFNPFSTAVLQAYMREELGWSEQFYGNTVSLQAVASLVASVAYGCYCRRVSISGLIHLAILQGVLCTVCYWFLWNQPMAVAVSLWVGFSYMTASLAQLDLAARLCPPQISATVFATLMAISNLGITLSYAVGGWAYETASGLWGRPLAFQVLVGVGASTTAACWWLAPGLAREIRSLESSAP